MDEPSKHRGERSDLVGDYGDPVAVLAIASSAAAIAPTVASASVRRLDDLLSALYADNPCVCGECLP
jgi:hypothetical protein